VQVIPEKSFREGLNLSP